MFNGHKIKDAEKGQLQRKAGGEVQKKGPTARRKEETLKAGCLPYTTYRTGNPQKKPPHA